jgi:hypothetical protein
MTMWDIFNSLFGWLLPAAKPSLPAPPPPLSWWQCPVPDQVTKELVRVEKVLDQVQQTPSWGAPVLRQRRTVTHFPVSTEWELFKPGQLWRIGWRNTQDPFFPGSGLDSVINYCMNEGW